MSTAGRSGRRAGRAAAGRRLAGAAVALPQQAAQEEGGCEHRQQREASHRRFLRWGSGPGRADRKGSWWIVRLGRFARFAGFAGYRSRHGRPDPAASPPEARGSAPDPPRSTAGGRPLARLARGPRPCPDRPRGPRPRRRGPPPRRDGSRAVLEPAAGVAWPATPAAFDRRLTEALALFAGLDRIPHVWPMPGLRRAAGPRPSGCSPRLRGPRRRDRDGPRSDAACRRRTRPTAESADGVDGRAAPPARRRGRRSRPRRAIAAVLLASFAVEPERRVAIELEAVLGLDDRRLPRDPRPGRRRAGRGRPPDDLRRGELPLVDRHGSGVPRPRARPARDRARGRRRHRAPAAAGPTSACSRRTTSPAAVRLARVRAGRRRRAGPPAPVVTARPRDAERDGAGRPAQPHRLVEGAPAARRRSGRPSSWSAPLGGSRLAPGRGPDAPSPVRRPDPHARRRRRSRRATPAGRPARHRGAVDRRPPRRDARPPRRGAGGRYVAFPAAIADALDAFRRRAAAAALAIPGPRTARSGRRSSSRPVPHRARILILAERRPVPSPP